MLHNGVNEMIRLKDVNDENRRNKRHDVKVYFNANGQPKGVQDYEIKAGIEDILPWIIVNKNVEWPNFTSLQ